VKYQETGIDFTLDTHKALFGLTREIVIRGNLQTGQFYDYSIKLQMVKPCAVATITDSVDGKLIPVSLQSTDLPITIDLTAVFEK